LVGFLMATAIEFRLLASGLQHMPTAAIEPRIIFMGTPDFAVPSLRALVEQPYMITVVTQPDRPAGRGGKLTPPPVKVAAQEFGLPIVQPESLKDPAFRAQLAELNPVLTVLVAYGEYVAPALLDLPRNGSINVHPSLLPRWRGSTPIQSAILAGDDETGVTIIKMDRGLDTGPILAQRHVPIGLEETHPQLAARLAQLGAELLAETIPAWLRGEIVPQPQDDLLATLTRTLKREDGLIDWTRPAEEIARRIRALQPWPGTYTYWNGKLLKVLHARPARSQYEGLPGSVRRTPEGSLLIGSGEGALQLLDVQLEGKPTTEARALLNGYPQIVGAILGAT
jgi:methionyl-tRNA formyltransferase